MGPPRYAIYFVPMGHTPLYEFGASVLGYDCYSGKQMPFIDGADAQVWRPVVKTSRSYGFHATLKAPFCLLDGTAEADLLKAAAEFARDHSSVWVGDLLLADLGGFLALVPKSRSTGIDELADRCVRAFDRFRAPMTDADRARRLAAPLSTRQLFYFERWGYPYVFSEFRFHMTLTDKLTEPARSEIAKSLAAKFERLPEVMRTLTVNQIAVTRQDDQGAPFQVVRPFPLSQSPLQPYASAF